MGKTAIGIQGVPYLIQVLGKSGNLGACTQVSVQVAPQPVVLPYLAS